MKGIFLTLALLAGIILSASASYALTESIPLIGADTVHSQYPSLNGSYQTVAIIDTGINYMHSALGGGFGPGFRVVAGWDFAENDANPMDDTIGHGTRMAGIIGSSNPVYTGVAPAVQFAALRVFDDSGYGTFAMVADALQWVIDHQVEYTITSVCLSLGNGGVHLSVPAGYDTIEAKLHALYDSGVFVVAGSGNLYYDTVLGSREGLQYPAISPYTISVADVWDRAGSTSVTWSTLAADYTQQPDWIVSHAQRGEALDLLAPGAMITSCDLSGGFTSTKGGTSSAVPHVVGAAVVLRQAIWEKEGRYASNDELLQIFQDTGVQIYDDGFNTNVAASERWYSRIDLDAALQSVMVPEPLTVALMLLLLPALLRGGLRPLFLRTRLSLRKRSEYTTRM